MISPISLEKFATMSVLEKAARMDAFLERLRSERNPFYERKYDLGPFVKPLCSTKIFLQHGDQSKLLWDFFDLVLQIEYVNSYFGFKNTTLDSGGFKLAGWNSPSNHVFYNSLTQAVIIGSRVEFERLMRFIYFAFEGNEVRGDSTFKLFKQWLIEKDSTDRLIYLIPFLAVSRRHDKKFRTAEIHTGSKLKSRTLALQEQSSDESGEIMELHNCVSNLARNMMPLFDESRPTGSSGGPDFDLSWLSPYATGEAAKLAGFIERWKADLDELER